MLQKSHSQPPCRDGAKTRPVDPGFHSAHLPSTWRIIPRTWIRGDRNHGDRNHGDRFRSLFLGLWDPFRMAVSWLVTGGDPNHLRYVG